MNVDLRVELHDGWASVGDEIYISQKVHHEKCAEIERLRAEEQKAYDRGFARGSGNEGAYQREIRRLKLALFNAHNSRPICNCADCEGHRLDTTEALRRG